MILPDNGKVVIIDDTPNDVKSLLLALTKERMPFLYFQDSTGDDLPPDNYPIENVRLVFLDLDLGISGTDENLMIRVVQSRLMRILKPHSPYALVIWSNHKEKLLDLLLKEFEGDFKEYKPIAHCCLDKSIILNPPDGFNVVEAIRTELKDKMSGFSSFNAFLLWESVVNNAAGSITSNFTNIFNWDENWDKNLLNLFFSLSKAQVGDDTVNEIGNNDKLLSAFEIINSTLIENIENGIKNRLDEININEIKIGGPGIEQTHKDKLNTSIHLLKSENLSHYFSGNIYEIDDAIILSEIITHNFKESKRNAVNESLPKLICLDITPACDYSKKKNYSRIMFGVKVSNTFKKGDLKDEDSSYRLCPVMEFDNFSYILFDFRHFQTYTHEAFEKVFTKPPNYRLRNNLLIDIQSQFSNHINRPGIVNVK